MHSLAGFLRSMVQVSSIYTSDVNVLIPVFAALSLLKLIQDINHDLVALKNARNICTICHGKQTSLPSTQTAPDIQAGSSAVGPGPRPTLQLQETAPAITATP